MPLLYEFTIDALCILDQYFRERSHLIDTLAEVHTHQTQYVLFDSSQHSLEVDLFTGEAKV